MSAKTLLRRAPVVDRAAVAWYRSRALKQRWKFVACELIGKREARYTPVGNSASVFLRHGTSDVIVAQETNLNRVYDPPVDLGDVRRIADLGAHVGFAAARLLSLYPRATAISFEPDPDTFRVLARSARLHPRWEVDPAAAWTETTRLSFAAAHDESSHLGHHDNAIEVRAVDIFPFLAGCDIVKINIEGAEWQLLEDPRFAGLDARAVVLEWHPWGDDEPTEDHATAALESSGLRIHQALRLGDLGMIWAIR